MIPDAVRKHQLDVQMYWAGTGQPTQEQKSGGAPPHPEFALTPEELQKRDALRHFVPQCTSDRRSSENGHEGILQVCTPWSLRGRLELHDWQAECVQRYLNRTENNGTIKVVTGAGKTLLALSIVERLHNERDQQLRVAVIVPTIVLMDQWREALLREWNNIPAAMIGRLGGGYHDDFVADCRILLCVLNSASAHLPRIVSDAHVDGHLLLIVDECHRAAAATMRRVFKTSRMWSLGLSATPEREDMDEDEEGEAQSAGGQCSYNDSYLGNEIGPIIYDMTFADAVRLGVLPAFDIEHYGLFLQPAERSLYQDMSREIDHLRDELRLRAGPRFTSSEGRFDQWVRHIAQQNNEMARAARRYVGKVSARKSLLYAASARSDAAIRLVRTTLNDAKDSRILLFHESIEQAMLLWKRLVDAGFPAVAENSQLPPGLREEGLRLYREGAAQVLVSVKSLIEGFNVPETDVGMIVASSGSGRQRIQTIGRVLRKHVNPDGEEKKARVCTLYMSDTVDEGIYDKTDWDNEVGVARNHYFQWTKLDELPVPRPGPPRSPLPRDDELDSSMFELGDPYPGRYEGTEYSADTRGNVFLTADKGQIVANSQDVPEKIKQVKGTYGVFRVTPRRHRVLVRLGPTPEWRTLYVMTLSESFRTVSGQGDVADVDVRTLHPGDIYRGDIGCAAEYSVVQRRNMRRVAQRVPGGQNYAQGEIAQKLLIALHEAEVALQAQRLTKVCLSRQGVAFVLWQGQARFVADIGMQGLFPSTLEEDSCPEAKE